MVRESINVQRIQNLLGIEVKRGNVMNVGIREVDMFELILMIACGIVALIGIVIDGFFLFLFWYRDHWEHKDRK